MLVTNEETILFLLSQRDPFVQGYLHHGHAKILKKMPCKRTRKCQLSDIFKEFFQSILFSANSIFPFSTNSIFSIWSFCISLVPFLRQLKVFRMGFLRSWNLLMTQIYLMVFLWWIWMVKMTVTMTMTMTMTIWFPDKCSFGDWGGWGACVKGNQQRIRKVIIIMLMIMMIMMIMMLIMHIRWPKDLRDQIVRRRPSQTVPAKPSQQKCKTTISNMWN